MKYIKLFEYFFSDYESFNQNEPKVGDYVILDHTSFNNPHLVSQLEGLVGIIIDIYPVTNGFPILVVFPEIENLVGYAGNSIRVEYNEILYWSDDKDILEAGIASKKYNL